MFTYFVLNYEKESYGLLSLTSKVLETDISFVKIKIVKENGFGRRIQNYSVPSYLPTLIHSLIILGLC